MSKAAAPKIILKDCVPKDILLAARAANFLAGRPKRQQAWLSYGEGGTQQSFYVKRTKAAIIVRPDVNE